MMQEVRRSGPSSGPRGRRVWFAGLCLLIVVVGAVIAFRAFPAFRHATFHQISLSVVRQEADYDALYFAKPAALPSHVTLGTPSEFSFAIKREGEPTRVGYTVILTDGQGTSLLTKGKIELHAGAAHVVTEDFSVPVAGAFEVGVVLSSDHTSIAFHGHAS
jgi:hypothetical protein